MSKPGRRPSRGHRQQVGAYGGVNDRDVRAIIKEGDADLLVEKAEALGHHLAALNLTSSQIRALFTKVKQLHARGIAAFQAGGEDAELWRNIKRELTLLRPKMAYAAARHKNSVPVLRDVLDKAIQEIEEFRHFQHFTDFFEAILAYHKEAGGK